MCPSVVPVPVSVIIGGGPAVPVVTVVVVVAVVVVILSDKMIMTVLADLRSISL